MTIDRTETLRNLEWVAFWGRITIYSILSGLFWLDFLRGVVRDFVLITILVVLRSAIAAAFLRESLQHWIRSYTNFFIYLVEFSVILRFTGADSSPCFVLYIFLIAAYALQASEARRVGYVTVLCCAAFALVMVSEYLTRGIRKDMFGTITARFLFIAFAGWFFAFVARKHVAYENEYGKTTSRLATCEALLNQFLKVLPWPIAVVDDGGFILHVSHALCNFTNTSCQAILGKHVETLAHRAGSLWASFVRMLANGENETEETVLDYHDMEHRMNIRMNSYTRASRHCFIFVCLDITEQKALTKNLTECHELIERLSKQVHDAAVEKNAAIDELAKRLGSPLTALLGFLDSLLSEDFGVINPEQEQALKECRGSVQKIFNTLYENQTY